MTVTITYARAGQVEPDDEQYIESFPANAGEGEAIAAGLIVTEVSDKFVVNPIDGSGRRPFYGVVQAKGDNDAKVVCLRKGRFTGYAEGNIPVGSVLMGGTTTAGHVKAGVKDGATPTARELLIGDYLGHPGEGSGNSPITAATNGQLIVFEIR